MIHHLCEFDAVPQRSTKTRKKGRAYKRHGALWRRRRPRRHQPRCRRDPPASSHHRLPSRWHPRATLPARLMRGRCHSSRLEEARQPSLLAHGDGVAHTRARGSCCSRCSKGRRHRRSSFARAFRRLLLRRGQGRHRNVLAIPVPVSHYSSHNERRLWSSSRRSSRIRLRLPLGCPFLATLRHGCNSWPKRPGSAEGPHRRR